MQKECIIIINNHWIRFSHAIMNYQTSCLISLFPITPYVFPFFFFLIGPKGCCNMLSVCTTVTNDRMSFAFGRYREAFILTYVGTHNFLLSFMAEAAKNALSSMGSEKRSTRNWRIFLSFWYVSLMGNLNDIYISRQMWYTLLLVSILLSHSWASE